MSGIKALIKAAGSHSIQRVHPPAFCQVRKQPSSLPVEDAGVRHGPGRREKPSPDAKLASALILDFQHPEL